MRKITLILSRHSESAHCSADELLTILRALNPEVIFSEARPEEKRCLEIRAVDMYREFRNHALVSVDRYELPMQTLLEIKPHLDRVFQFVARASSEYRQLENEIDLYGFKQMNSVACTTILARMFEIETRIIAESGDPNLVQALEWWRRSNQKREVEMINNVYKYSREKVFGVGVFLVGASHKTGIVREIEKSCSTDAGLIEWNLDYGPGRIQVSD